MEDVLEVYTRPHDPDMPLVCLDETSKQLVAETRAPSAEARRLAERFEWHYTPKHGSWLNMAEAELAVLATQCLDRRIPNKETLNREVAAWQTARNKTQSKADWRFTTADARIKLKRLYPRFE